jgi:hypothetical protein
MGADLMSTVILNRKPWGQDPGDGEKGTEQPAKTTLFEGDGREERG